MFRGLTLFFFFAGFGIGSPNHQPVTWDPMILRGKSELFKGGVGLYLSTSTKNLTAAKSDEIDSFHRDGMCQKLRGPSKIPEQ